MHWRDHKIFELMISCVVTVVRVDLKEISAFHARTVVATGRRISVSAVNPFFYPKELTPY